MIREINASGQWSAPVVTEVCEAATFYPAETYHQRYFANHPQQGYCRWVIAPKMREFREAFAGWLKPPQ
jgi:peptide-methionine (S)-S-oxide reductase